MFERESLAQTDFDLVFGLSEKRQAAGPVLISDLSIAFTGPFDAQLCYPLYIFKYMTCHGMVYE
jgi:hypothetical protein